MAYFVKAGKSISTGGRIINEHEQVTDKILAGDKAKKLVEKGHLYQAEKSEPLVEAEKAAKKPAAKKSK
jgi:hypothetical protein